MAEGRKARVEGRSARHNTSLNYALHVLTDKKYNDYIDKIILFGSMARGEEKYHSDVDLLICVSEDFPAKLARKLRMEATPDDPELPEVELKFQRHGTEGESFRFSENIRKEGKVLWTKD